MDSRICHRTNSLEVSFPFGLSFALSHSVQHANYACPTFNMGKLTLIDWLIPTPFSDSSDGAIMGLPHYVSCGKQRLFDPLCIALFNWVVRVDPFSCHPGVSIVSYNGYIN